MTTTQLERTLGAELTMEGIARTLLLSKASPHLLSERFRWQPFDTWLGKGRRDLENWTSQLLAEAIRSLRPSASTFVSFEVYAPWLHRNRPQYFRWIRSTDLSQAPADIALCRASPSRWGPRNYWLARLGNHRGAVFMDQEHEVEPVNVRVLQYGLDLLARAPTRAEAQIDGAHIILTVRSWLPSEQRRLLLALAKDVSPEVGRLPLKFRLSNNLVENVFTQLRELGIVIETKS